MTDGGAPVATKESGTTMSIVRRDGKQCAHEDVTVLDEQSREDASKNLIIPLSRAGPSTGNGSGGTRSCRRWARSAGDRDV
jgi:hypothetical protein